VQIERRHFDIKDYLWSGTLGLVGVLGQAMVVFFITFFLLASGDSFRRKLVKLAGPTFSKKKVTIQVLDEITEQIQRYLMVQVFTSVLVGLATWAALRWIGLERAAVWGAAAALLNLVPYLGSIVNAGGLALVGFLQFGTIGMAILVGGVSLFINTLEGNLLTPWLTSRASRLNPVVVFVGVLIWGWLLGIWGLFLGVPLLMVTKAVCDRIDDLKPIGELLGA
jgi:predicted PurR-regulated permease PerM